MKDIIHLENYIHPMDKALSQRIINAPVIKQLLDIAFEEKMDTVNYYLYNSSCIKLPLDHPAVIAFQDGKKRFNIEAKNHLYVVRNYDFDVKVVGYTDPIILISSRLLEENNAFLLKERVAMAAASVAAEHHKLDFLLWIYDNFSGLINIPLLDAALTGLICEWERSRQYTLDRAFLLYTENISLSKMNILYGSVPYDILKNFNFCEIDTYFKQVDDFNRKENVIDIATSVFSILQHEIWIPARYEEVCNFYEEVMV